jgi:hypothetical protein
MSKKEPITENDSILTDDLIALENINTDEPEPPRRCPLLRVPCTDSIDCAWRNIEGCGVL